MPNIITLILEYIPSGIVFIIYFTLKEFVLNKVTGVSHKKPSYGFVLIPAAIGFIIIELLNGLYVAQNNFLYNFGDSVLPIFSFLYVIADAIGAVFAFSIFSNPKSSIKLNTPGGKLIFNLFNILETFILFLFLFLR